MAIQGLGGYLGEPQTYVNPIDAIFADAEKKKGDPVKDHQLNIMSKAVTNKYKHLNWVQRGLNPGEYGSIKDEQGNDMTHLLSQGEDADGNAYVYPEIIQDEKTGELKRLGRQEAHEYALKSKTTIPFKDKELAEFYSRNGLINHSFPNRPAVNMNGGDRIGDNTSPIKGKTDRYKSYPDLLLPGGQKNIMPSSIIDIEKQRLEASPDNPFAFLQQSQAQSQDDINRAKKRQAASSITNSLGEVAQALFNSYGANQGAPISPIKSSRQRDQAREDQLFNMEQTSNARNNAQNLQLMLEDQRYTRGRTDKAADFNTQNKARIDAADKANEFRIEAAETQDTKRIEQEGRVEDARIRSEKRAIEAQDAKYDKQREDALVDYENGKTDKVEYLRQQQDIELEYRKKAKEAGVLYSGSRSTAKPYQEVRDIQGNTVGISELEAGEVADWINEQRRNPIERTVGEGKKAHTAYDPALPGLGNEPKNNTERDSEVRRYYSAWQEAQQPQVQEQAPVDATTGAAIPSQQANQEVQTQQQVARQDPSPGYVQLGTDIVNTVNSDVYQKTTSPQARLDLLTSIAEAKKKNIPELKDVPIETITKLMQDYMDECSNTETITNPPASKK